MIKSVTVTNHLNESIKLELGGPEKSGFAIQDITGLGPVKANLSMTELSTSDGALYNSARLTSRNIVLTLRLLGIPDVETVRQKSYKYFPVKKRIRLEIETDNRTSEIYGIVETNEPNIFSNASTIQVSIVCPDPFFYSVDGSTTTVLSGIAQAFEFPFSNESMAEDVISLGEIITSHEQIISYYGDSDIGITIDIKAIGSATNVTIYNAETNESMKIDTTKLETLTGYGIIDDDEILISTVKGNKFVTLIRDGVYTNILNCLDKDADWLQLRKGDNVFAFIADTGSNNLHIKILNQTLYEGV